MREGPAPMSPFAGGADCAPAARSFAHAAEDRVRAGGGSRLAWNGATLTTEFQPIYCVRRATCLGFEALVRARDGSGEPINSEHFFAREPVDGRSLLDWSCRALHLRSYAT